MLRPAVSLIVFFAVATPVSWAANKVTARPNIILVFIDDMGWADLGCFGNSEVSTPSIDRMAAEGLAFEQFYVNASICSPSRVAVSTGQYSQRWQITSYLARRSLNRDRQMAQWLDPDAPMLARMLHHAGYATGHFGKWHMGGQRDVDDAPPISQYGFDRSLTNFEGMGPKLLPLTMKPGWDKPGRIWEDAERLGGPVTWKQRSKITGGFIEAAIDFIRDAEKKEQPFYVNLWPDDVHSPFFPSVENWKEQKRDRYLAVLEEMDQQFSVLFDFIREDESLSENTLILICSDNGHEPGAGSAGELKGCKGTLYEGGIRSPLIVWGPPHVAPDAAGTRNLESVFAAFDLVPSLLSFAHATASENASFDGEDMLPILLGKTQASRQQPIFFGRPPDRKNMGRWEELPDLAVRDGRWKLLCDYDGNRRQLYDLDADPAESANLAEAYPDVAADLATALTRWHRSTRQ